MDYVSKNAYIYDGIANKVTKIDSMFHERYTFQTVLKDQFVYVIGGRTYGEDSVAIRKECERWF